MRFGEVVRILILHSISFSAPFQRRQRVVSSNTKRDVNGQFAADEQRDERDNAETGSDRRHRAGTLSRDHLFPLNGVSIFSFKPRRRSAA